MALILSACTSSTPTPIPTPTPLPTATPSARDVLEGLLFTIRFDDQLIATEEIHTQWTDDQLVVFAEQKRFTDHPVTERRVVVLSEALNPVRYDLERVELGQRSIWLAQRNGDAVDCLNNNYDWYAPVLFERIGPAPRIVREASPSALPYVLMALQFTEGRALDPAAEPVQFYLLDVTEDLPAMRQATLRMAEEQSEAIIGTVALQGQTKDGPNASWSMWVRPGSRVLFGAEIHNYQFGLWDQLKDPLLSRPGTLTIARVSKLPSWPPSRQAVTPMHNSKPLTFIGGDDSERGGTLYLPEGTGPFPCIVLHSAGGVVARAQPGQTFLGEGYAVFSYDKSGVGQSEGVFQRAPTRSLAQDALHAAEMLANVPDIDAKRIVFFGLGEGGQVGAQVASLPSPYHAAILGNCACQGSLFPKLIELRIERQLAPFYTWDKSQVEAYRQASVERWQEWLYEDRDEISLLGRRASLKSLQEMADLDLYELLSNRRIPILVIHGANAQLITADEARKLVNQVAATPGPTIELAIIEAVGDDLGAIPDERIVSQQVEKAILEWLTRVIAP